VQGFVADPSPLLHPSFDAFRPAVWNLRSCGWGCRADKGGVVHACIGKLSFPTEHLYTNFGSFASAIMLARPKGAKGSGVGGYVLAVHLSRTMGPGVPLNLPSMVAAISDVAKQRR
jgi:large subunit ribosomal protein L1